MPRTYEPIASQTLSSSASTVTISSIPGTYTDLVLVLRLFPVNTNVVSVAFRINSDTGSNYSETNIYGTGSAVGSERFSSGTSGRFGRAIDFRGTAYTAVTHFMSYANTNVYKTILTASANADSPSAPGVERSVDLWRSTAAITSIDLLAGSNSFASGSTISLYGIKAA